MKKLFLVFVLLASGQLVVSAQSTDVQALLEKHTCYSCHSVKKKMIGPTWPEIAQKGYTKKRFAQLVAKPEPQNWPTYSPMAALPKVPKADLDKIYEWVNSLK
jgi:cytochrome c